MEPVDLNDVRGFLARTRTFHGRPIRVASIYSRHPEEKCFRVETDRESRAYKVRFATASSRLSVATEREAFRVLREQGVTWTPHVYEFRDEDPAYMILDYKSGDSLDKSLEWVTHAASIAAGLGRLLTDIHSVSGDHFGHLAGPRYPSWRSFLDTRFWHHVRLVAGAGLLDEVDLRMVRGLYEQAAGELSRVSPTLLHGDVKPANIVFDAERRRVELVDFELARFGDLDFEWVRLHHLSLRWPEYRRHVAQPLLADQLLTDPSWPLGDAKTLLYSLFHVCSIMAFECEVGLPVPGYRLADLAEVLRALRTRGL